MKNCNIYSILYAGLLLFMITACNGDADKQLAPNVETDKLAPVNIAYLNSDGWEMIWNDEFNSAGRPSEKWRHDIWVPGHVNNELQHYTSNLDNSSVSNGVLKIKAAAVYNRFTKKNDYYSARLNSTQSWAYGRFEARMLLPGGWGTWPAFWMLADNIHQVNWPECGEIDIMEEVGFNQNEIHSTLHSKCCNWMNPSRQRTKSIRVSDPTTNWHVYALEWHEDRIDFFVDNQKYHTVYNDRSGNDSWPFNKKFHIILNLAVGGNWGGLEGVDPNIWPRTLQVDYVRVYQKSKKPQVPIGQTITLKGNNGRYLSGENGIHSMICNRYTAQNWEYFRVVDAGGGKVALQSMGRYVSCEYGMKAVTCNRTTIKEWEKFDWIVTANGKVALRGNNGKYISSENGWRFTTCNRDMIQDWEEFEINR